MFDLSSPDYPYLEDINEGVLRLVREPPGSRTAVLDVGCGRGALGEAIKELGYAVWGIEQNAEALAVAKRRLDRVIGHDITDATDLPRLLGDQMFDVIVFSDVLEHLPDPLSIVRAYARHLAPDGRLVVSVPNIANWQHRLRLLMGRFEYEDTGVMDKTHLRFFTFSTAERLLEEAGFEVVGRDFTPYVVRAMLPLVKRALTSKADAGDERAIIDSPSYRFYQKFIYPLEYGVGSLWRQLLAFRIVLAARKRPVSLSEQARRGRDS